MNSIPDGSLRKRLSDGEIAAERTRRISSFRADVARMRGLATTSRPGFREHLLRLARDIERHALALEDKLANPGTSK